MSSLNRFSTLSSPKTVAILFFGIVILFVEYVPTRRLGELRDDGKQFDKVYLHGDDGYSPSPLAFLSEVVC